MIAGPPSFQRDKPTKAELAEIKTLNESVNRANQIILGYIVLKCRWENCFGSDQSPPRSLTSSAPDRRFTRGITASVGLFTHPGPKADLGFGPAQVIPASKKDISKLGY